jgi:diguanylate cyclase (GGDEF)-like protein/putative nucleotidyltransferase with HDIG domain
MSIKINRLYQHYITVNPLLPAHLNMFALFISTVLLVLFTGRSQSGFKIIYLLPVIFYSLKFGAKWGYIISTISSFLIIFFHFIALEKSVLNLEADLVLIGTFFLFSWLIGNVITLERSIKSQLSEIIIRDELTGLYNYRYFQQQLKKMIENYSHDGSKIGLIMIDLDNFKLYNEMMGHSTGDTLLQHVSNVIKSYLDKEDFAARYGGDEFVVVTPCQEASQVINKAEKMRKEINTISEDALGSDWNLSASFGIALFPDHTGDKQGLLQKADEALYKAKITKGNRVQLYYSIFDRLSGQMMNKEKEFLSTIKTLMSIINARDQYTFNHSERVLVYVQAICRELRLTSKDMTVIEYAAFLHDIGKIEIGRDILNKSMPLTEKERKILEQHPLWGAEIIKPIKKMEPVLPVIIHHHERFDGKGYPHGLKGNDIPLGARIITVANAFDLFTSELPFQEGKSIKEGIEYLKQGKGTLFDPLIVDAFAACLNQYQNVYQLVEWPRDLCRLVPAGYLPGSFLMGCQYVDFYSGDFHFIIKTTAYLAAAIVNNEKCLYFVGEKNEEILLKEVKGYYYHGTQVDTILRKNQLNRMAEPEDLLKLIHRRAKLEFETRKIFKQLRDEALEEGFISLRVILEGSSLQLSEEELIFWEKNLSRCIKDLEIVVICLYNIDEEGTDMCRLLYNLHDKPLLNGEETGENAKEG